MAVFIGRLNAVNYIFQSSEIAASKVPGIAIIGAICLAIDTGAYYIVNEDLTLEPYAMPITATIAGDVEIGAVEIKNSTDDTRAVVGANGLYVDVRNINAGTALIGKVGIDQATANANEVVLKASSAIVGSVAIDQTTSGTTNAVSRAATVVTPTPTASTNAYVLIPNALLDTLNNLVATFTILNSGADSIHWKVIAGNGSGLTEAIEAQAEATVVAGAYGTFSVNPAVWRYYGVYIKSAVAETPGEGTVTGITKG